MYRVLTLNRIAPEGLACLPAPAYAVSDSEADPQAILVRSAKLHDYAFPESLLAIARAGAGVDNIPLDRCSEAGIAVFSTPGANANAVKELALCGLLLCSRDIPGAIRWVRRQAEEGEVAQVVEKGKAAFAGPELYRKTLGVIGLGAIGSLVANAAVDLGMEVVGYDPYLSVASALRLSPHVRVAGALPELYRQADYLTIHIHCTPETTGFLNAEAIAAMKPGARVLNLARGALVEDDAMLAALDSGRIAAYVTDFPTNRLVASPHVIAMPHLGASTPESEQNCAVMAARELRDYLENGNLHNSVNLPEAVMARSGVQRLCILHRNVPGMLARITTLLSQDGVNVENLSNTSRGNYAYTLVDLGAAVEEPVLADIRALEQVIRLRVLNGTPESRLPG